MTSSSSCLVEKTSSQLTELVGKKDTSISSHPYIMDATGEGWKRQQSGGDEMMLIQFSAAAWSLDNVNLKSGCSTALVCHSEHFASFLPLAQAEMLNSVHSSKLMHI